MLQVYNVCYCSTPTPTCVRDVYRGVHNDIRGVEELGIFRRHPVFLLDTSDRFCTINFRSSNYRLRSTLDACVPKVISERRLRAKSADHRRLLCIPGEVPGTAGGNRGISPALDEITF